MVGVLTMALVAVDTGIGSAGDIKPNPFPFAMTPPPASLNPRSATAPPAPTPLPAPVPVQGFAYPCCVPQGYWTYQWVPTSSTTYVWVPGYVAADGTMVDGSYQPQVVTGGYYQPVWINGY